MTVRNDDRSIRPDFLLGHFERQEAAWAKRYHLIAARDEKHKDVNRKYGFREPDGSIPIGCRSHINLEYKAEYDRIEREFRPLYEAVTRDEERMDRDEGITIFEYLVLDNLDAAERDRFIRAATAREPTNYISLRAFGEVQRQAVGLRVGNVPQLVAMLINHSSYAVQRCQKFFNLRPWDIEAWHAVYAYRRRYKSALHLVASELRAS